MIGMEDYTTSEKCLTYLMKIYSILFLVWGYVFLLFPRFTLEAIDRLGLWLLDENSLFKWLGWELRHGKVYAQGTSQGTDAEYFWVFLSFSMMMTIAACSYIASKDIRKNRSVIVPLILAKLASSLCAFTFYYSRGIFAYLVIFITDFPLVLLTLYFYLKADSGRIPEVYQSWKIDKDKYREMCIGSGKTKVACIHDENKLGALDQVLEETGFYDILERKWKGSGKKKEDFLIAVKPNFMMTYNKIDESTYTDPELVEHLLNELHKGGYTRLALVESRNTYGLYFEKRAVKDVAEYVGYQGKNYEICDLTEKEEMKEFDYGGPLGRHFVGRTWRDAGFRISFAKNKTHSFCYYTLTLKNIYGTLPLENKLLEYHKKREFDWPTIETLKHFPVHYGIIDAFLSADGPMGVISDVRPNKTKTVIGGEKLVAVDWVGAQKMGLNPLKSRFMKIAVHEFGSPEDKIELSGDDTPYRPWKNVHPFLADILALAEECWVLSHSFMSTFIFAEEYFPRKPMSIVFRFFRWLILPILPLFFRTGHRLRKSRRRP
jgi:uncharacterized protein (DUF362 family)